MRLYVVCPTHLLRKGISLPFCEFTEMMRTRNRPFLLSPLPRLHWCVKNLPAMQETLVWLLGWEDLLEKG